MNMKTSTTVINAAEELLEKLEKPLHYKEITDLIINDCDLKGRTPYETVRSEIGTSSKFIRVAEGIYALSKWREYKPIRFAKDIAYDILKSKGSPLALNDLGKRVLEERLFKGRPKTIIQNAISHDARFYIDWENELVYLVDWKMK